MNNTSARQCRPVRRPRHLERLRGHAEGPQEIRPALQVVAPFQGEPDRPWESHVLQRVCEL